MIIVEVKNSDSIEKALKQYKRKVYRTGILKELRKRKHFEKPSVVRRSQILKATYKRKKFGSI